MSEWWTYRLSDFLMFSPGTYWRLVELYNREVWPAQVAALAAGVALLVLAALRPGTANRVIPAALAAAWWWVGWAFHWQRYVTINWAAAEFAVAWWIEAGLLGWAAVGQAGGGLRARGPALRAIGWTLAVVGVLLYPWAGAAAGRPLAQAEVFGLMPEPTALATLGLLLVRAPGRTVRLAIVPVLSLLIGAATLWLLSG